MLVCNFTILLQSPCPMVDCGLGRTHVREILLTVTEPSPPHVSKSPLLVYVLRIPRGILIYKYLGLEAADFRDLVDFVT